jgi:DMSO/TMAO reductase YedYZ heme-binding membrane subunit
MSFYSWLSAQLTVIIYGSIPLLYLQFLGVESKSIFEQTLMVQIVFGICTSFLIYVTISVFKICKHVKQPNNITDSLKVALLAPFYNAKSPKK